jgi:hypothetical protein
MRDEFIRVKEKGAALDIPFSACILYHGYDSIGGLALGYRLMAYSLRQLCGEEVPEREKITVRTAFPGPGFTDAVEMVTRARSRGKFEILSPDAVQGPEGVYGKMYFEICYAGRTLKLALRDGALPEAFILTGRAVKSGKNDGATLAAWTRLKHGLADAVWAAEPEELFVIQP